MSPNTGLYAGAGVLGRSASAAGLAAVPASGHASFGRWLRRAAVEDRPWHAELWSSVPAPDARGLWVSSPGRRVGADPRPLFAVADATGSAAGDAAKLCGDALGLSVPPGARPPGTALRAPPLVAVARTSLVPPSICSSAAGSLGWSPASVRAVGHARGGPGCTASCIPVARNRGSLLKPTCRRQQLKVFAFRQPAPPRQNLSRS